MELLKDMGREDKDWGTVVVGDLYITDNAETYRWEARKGRRFRAEEAASVQLVDKQGETKCIAYKYGVQVSVRCQLVDCKGGLHCMPRGA